MPHNILKVNQCSGHNLPTQEYIPKQIKTPIRLRQMFFIHIKYTNTVFNF
jgi:hypothetical protein